MKNNITKTGIPCIAFALVAVLLALHAGSLTAQNPYPDYDFKAANADGDTLYYRITSSTAPYTVAVTRCHDSVFHTLPWPQNLSQVEQPGFVYPVYDYDSAITVPASVTHNNITYAVTAVDNEAFYMQRNLKSVSLPSSVKTIREGAFMVSSLCHISMPNVEQIESYAFYQAKLSQVDIPAGVTILPEVAFYYCPLTKITFHEGLQEIVHYAFSPELIDTLIFPQSLRKIALGDNSPFSIMTGDSVALKDIACRYVEFKPGTEPLELADYTFAWFNHLEKVILPDNVVRLGENCFQYTNIQTIVIPPLIDTISAGCFEDCHSLSSVILPQQLTTIDNYAFSGTPMLTQIAIPASVTSIGKKAFYTGSGGLRVLDIYCEVPPTITALSTNATFYYTDSIYVRVPCGKTATYQSAPGWSSYSNLVYDECVGVEEQESSAFKVYPNPVEDVVFVELRGAEITSVALYDLQGRVVTGVCDTPLQKATTTLNMKSLPAGVYVLRVTDAEGREHQQKIVRR